MRSIKSLKSATVASFILTVSVIFGQITISKPVAMAQPNEAPVNLSNIDCGGGMGNPHFSQGTFRSSGLYQIHAQARNWCNNIPNQLTLATVIYRSSWRGWLMQEHVGNKKNPQIKNNATKSKANKLVAVAECSPGSWYRWRVDFENAAIIQGEPWGSLHPIMSRETPEEIECSPK